MDRDNAGAYSDLYLNTRERPNVLSPLQCQALLSEYRHRPIKRPTRMMQDRPESEKIKAKCRRCKQTGHLATDLDEQGKTKVSPSSTFLVLSSSYLL
jgi:hypothetical protein